MDRNEFLKGLALTPFASLIKFDGDNKPKPKNKKAEQDLNKLFEAFNNREPIEICGVEFLITNYQIEQDHFEAYGEKYAGKQSITIELISR